LQPLGFITYNPSNDVHRNLNAHPKIYSQRNIKYPQRNIKIYVVYHAFIHSKRENWHEVIDAHLTDLVDCGLADAAHEVHVTLMIDDSITRPNTTFLLTTGTNTILKSIPKAKITTHLENRFEYFAIRKLWDLGQAVPPDEENKTLFLYFHSKGMWHHKNYTIVRSEMYIQLYNAVIQPWQRVIHQFQKNPILNKAGFMTSRGGWQWFNFVWIRASYLKRVVCPHAFLSENENFRYYYESWVAYLSPNGTYCQPFPSDSISPRFLNATGVAGRDSLTLCHPNVSTLAFDPEDMYARAGRLYPSCFHTGK
jgi:hypothetical protein